MRLGSPCGRNAGAAIFIVVALLATSVAGTLDSSAVDAPEVDACESVSESLDKTDPLSAFLGLLRDAESLMTRSLLGEPDIWLQGEDQIPNDSATLTSQSYLDTTTLRHGDYLDILAEANAKQEEYVAPSTFMLDVLKAQGHDYDSVDAIPTPILAAFLLTASPLVDEPSFHIDDPETAPDEAYGSDWFDLAKDRYEDLTTSIHATSLSGAGGTETGYPSDASLASSENERRERLLLSAPMLRYSFFETNANGELGHAMPFISLVALGMAADAGFFGLDPEGNPCSLPAMIMDNAIQLAAAALGIVGKINLAPEKFWHALEDAANGTWHDFFLDDALNQTIFKTLNSVNATRAAEVVVQNLQSKYSNVMQLYFGTRTAAWGLATSKTTSGGGGGAATDPEDKAEVTWEVEALKSVTDNGAVDVIESLVPLLEEGTITQVTSKKYVLIAVEERQPGTYTTGGWKSKDCAKYWAGLGAAAGAGAAGGAAGGAVAGSLAPGAGTAAGAAAGAAGGAVTGGAAYVFTQEFGCKEKTIHDEGMYWEMGTFINYWSDFAWAGAGLLVLGNDAVGNISIVGSNSQEVIKPAFQSNVYENQVITGWQDGKDDAFFWREQHTKPISEEQLKEFRNVVSGKGQSSITIHVECAGSPPDADSAELGICLSVVLGSDSVGELHAAGYGPVETYLTGVDDTGYVEVDGNREDSPVTLSGEGEGLNSE